jgi:DNA-binding response OmpR family regulator
MPTRILLIEDNIDVLETTEEILSLADYEVFTAQNGKQGVEQAKKHQPDLIICDVMMPELDGYGVLRILSRNSSTCTIPFVFLTAKADRTDVRKGMNLGADDYITKPFDESELLETIEARLKKIKALQKDYSADIDGFSDFVSNATTQSALAELPNNRKLKKYKRKDVIFHEYDHANYLIYILSGQVKCVKTDEYGKEFVNDIYTAGNFIGYMSLLAGKEYMESAIAMENTEVAIIPQQDFLALIDSNRDVMIQFIKLLAGNVIEREEKLLQLAYSPVRERVATAILTLQQKLGGPDCIEIKVSRDDMASMVGTAKESLIRTLSEFKKDNIIQIEGQLILIKNQAHLNMIAEGNYHLKN